MAVADQTRALDKAGLEDAANASAEAPCTPAEKNGLLLVGFFKLFKAVFFAAIGAAALHLIHKDVGELVLRVRNALPVDPEGRLVSTLLDKAHLLDAHSLRRIGTYAFIYAGLCLIEGTGLVLRKRWAEYFTVSLTVLGLPIELYELARRATWIKAGALVLNLAILIYLLWVLQRRRAERGAS